MRAVVRVLIPPVLSVARGAHVFRVMLSISVGAFCYFHHLFHLFLDGWVTARLVVILAD